MLRPEDLSAFLQSDVAKEAKALALKPRNQVVPNDFYLIRDFILYRIIQSNAQGPMPVRNISERHIKRAKISEDGGAVISVSNSFNQPMLLEK